MSAKVGIQTPSLRKQGTIKNWIPLHTGKTGFLLPQERLCKETNF